MRGWTKRHHLWSWGPRIHAGASGTFSANISPGPPVRTGPMPGTHRQKNDPRQLGTSPFVLFAGRYDLCGLPATATEGRTWQPAAPNPACVPGTEAGGGLHPRPPHHGVPPDLNSQLNPSHPPSPSRAGTEANTVMFTHYPFSPISISFQPPSQQTPWDLYSFSKLNTINEKEIYRNEPVVGMIGGG